MANVRLSIANREYIVTCKDGEETHLYALGAMVNDTAQEAGGSSGGLNETRLLLFSALLLADKLHDVNSGTDQAGASNIGVDANETTKMLEKLAERLEAVADRLEQ